MSLSGLCEICERPGVEHTCDRCGKLVCDRHFDASVDVCVQCAAELGQGPQRGDHPAGPDGVDTYRF